MKKIVLVLTALLAFGVTAAHADEATEQAIIKTIMDGNAYVKKNLRGMDDTIAKERSTSPSSLWFRGRSPSLSIIQKV
jgi:hypothetical protein